MDEIGLGGGCHWCTEGIFQMLKGVLQVDQGYILSDAPSDTWAEAIIIHFDPSAIALPILIEVHLRTHAASKPFVAESKYRSAIYVFNDKQKQRAIETIQSLQTEFEAPIETRILPHREFRPSDERYQNYYVSDPQKPFCRRYIDPKLDFIRQNFADFMSASDMQR